VKQPARRLLVFTNAYPYPQLLYYGIFVDTQVKHWRNSGVEVEVFFINGRRSKWNYFRGVVAWTWKMIRAGRDYDAIVAHHSYCVLIAAFIRPPGLPLIYQVHEGTIHFWKLNELLVRLAVRLSDKVIYVSRNLPDHLGYVISERDIIPCGVDLDLFRPGDRDEARRILGWDSREEIVLYAAKERKYYERYELVVEAVEEIRREGRGVKLVRLEGVPPERVPVYLNASDLLLVASHGEGSPKIVKEGLACNRPVVALRVGSVAQLLEGVSSGFLAKNNSTDLALQMRRALALKGAGEGREKMAPLSSRNTSAALLEACLEVIGSSAARHRKGVVTDAR